MASEYVTVNRESSDPMVQWEWRFYYLNGTLWLDYYGQYERQSRRHKFRLVESYYRLDLRGSTMKEADVVLPVAVTDEAINTFCERVTVKRWSERR